LKKFFIGNLPFSISETTLRESFGGIVPLFIKILTEDGKAKGCAYVGIKNEDVNSFLTKSKTWVFHNRIPRVEPFTESKFDYEKIPK
jgi:RNA recognition motif-containing protein